MKADVLQKDKNRQNYWSDYLAYEDEPKTTKRYNLNQDIEDEIIAYKPFLKHRVWRNMHKLQRQNARASRRQKIEEVGSYRWNRLHNRHRLVQSKP